MQHAPWRQRLDLAMSVPMCSSAKSASASAHGGAERLHAVEKVRSTSHIAHEQC